jgi:ABC-type sugar transport system ATPase subunit
MAIAANITLASWNAVELWWIFCPGGIAADYVRRFSIKTPALFSQVATLSGGNQRRWP